MRRVTAVARNSLRAYRVGDGLRVWGPCYGRRVMISAGNRSMWAGVSGSLQTGRGASGLPRSFGSGKRYGRTRVRGERSAAPVREGRDSGWLGARAPPAVIAGKASDAS